MVDVELFQSIVAMFAVIGSRYCIWVSNAQNLQYNR